MALVQASGPAYPGALTAAPEYPAAEDEDGDILKAGSGTLAIFSAAEDGTGPYSTPLLTARPGPMPAVHTTYRLKGRWYTRVDEDICFARWLLIPVGNGG